MQPQPPEMGIHVQAASQDSHSAKPVKSGRLLEEIISPNKFAPRLRTP